MWLSLMIARRTDWKRAEQSAARFQVAIAAAQCGAVSGVRHSRHYLELTER
jgi:hypothetical protein